MLPSLLGEPRCSVGAGPRGVGQCLGADRVDDVPQVPGVVVSEDAAQHLVLLAGRLGHSHGCRHLQRSRKAQHMDAIVQQATTGPRQHTSSLTK